MSRSWDVSELSGKRARLEIVDDTPSDKRGYVMIDDIQFGDGASSDAEDGQDRRYPYTNRQRANMLRFQDLPVPVQRRYDAAVQQIYFAMDTEQMRLHAGEDYEGIIKRLRTLAETAAGLAGVNDLLTKQLLTAEVVSAWVRHNVQYFFAADEGRRNRNDPKYLLREQTPKCDCSGFTALTFALSKSLGLICEHAGGTTRAYGTYVDLKDCHGWVVYTIDGKVIPSDTTNPPEGDESRFYEPGCFRRLMGKTDEHLVLPLHRVEREAFLARHFTHYYHYYRWLDAEPFMDLTWEAWRDMDSKHGKRLQQDIASSDKIRNRRFNESRKLRMDS